MLVLKRKASESITVDGPARIVVIRSSTGSVSLGIDAGPDVKILRSEITKNDEPDQRVANDTANEPPDGEL